jgi:hypothetical protein
MKRLVSSVSLLAMCLPTMASSTPQSDVSLDGVSAEDFQRSAAAHLSMTFDSSIITMHSRIACLN